MKALKTNKEIISSIEISFVTTSREATSMMLQGYTPVECNFGDISITDRYDLDHHGKFSHRPAVAVQAATMKLSNFITKFVVTGEADLDAIYAIGVLSGAITPHIGFAEAIGKVDTDPVHYDWENDEYAKYIAYFEECSEKEQSYSSFYKNLNLLVRIVENPNAKEIEDSYKAFLFKMKTPPRVDELFGNGIGFLKMEKDFQEVLNSYKLVDIIVALCDDQIVIGVESKEKAEQILGKGGLNNIWPLLTKEIKDPIDEKKAWGGRENIGGSPRGMKMTSEHGYQAARIIFNYIRDKKRKLA